MKRLAHSTASHRRLRRPSPTDRCRMRLFQGIGPQPAWNGDLRAAIAGEVHSMHFSGLSPVRGGAFEFESKTRSAACLGCGYSSSIDPRNHERMRLNMCSKAQTRAAATVSDPRWAAVVARDAAADGKFVYSVETTGVYCRPSCAARLARPENVRFHASATDAERAGFRPCKRCKPDQPPLAGQHAAMVAELCRLIEDAEQCRASQSWRGAPG